MPAHDGTILTIGHSTHALEAFVTLLQRHCVTVVADVRAVPYSRFNPQFNREPLADSLAEHGMKYVFVGRELGGRSDDPSCYDNGRICYNRLGGTQSFQDGIDCAVRGAANHRIALMCAEKEPLECHRALLVAPALEARGVPVGHILAGGALETHADAMDRLLAMHDEPEQGDLFGQLDTRVEGAIAKQAKHELRFDRDGGVATHEQHAQKVVLDFARNQALRTILPSADGIVYKLFQDAVAVRALAEFSHQIIPCHAKQPGRGIVWKSANPPSVKCFHQGGLNGVLYSLDVLHSYPARQDGDKPPVFVPEEVLNQFRRAHEVTKC